MTSIIRDMAEGGDMTIESGLSGRGRSKVDGRVEPNRTAPVKVEQWGGRGKKNNSVSTMDEEARMVEEMRLQRLKGEYEDLVNKYGGEDKIPEAERQAIEAKGMAVSREVGERTSEIKDELRRNAEAAQAAIRGSAKGRNIQRPSVGGTLNERVAGEVVYDPKEEGGRPTNYVEGVFEEADNPLSAPPRSHQGRPGVIALPATVAELRGDGPTASRPPSVESTQAPPGAVYGAQAEQDAIIQQMPVVNQGSGVGGESRNKGDGGNSKTQIQRRNNEGRVSGGGGGGGGKESRAENKEIPELNFMEVEMILQKHVENIKKGKYITPEVFTLINQVLERRDELKEKAKERGLFKNLKIEIGNIYDRVISDYEIARQSGAELKDPIEVFFTKLAGVAYSEPADPELNGIVKAWLDGLSRNVDYYAIEKRIELRKMLGLPTTILNRDLKRLEAEITYLNWGANGEETMTRLRKLSNLHALWSMKYGIDNDDAVTMGGRSQQVKEGEGMTSIDFENAFDNKQANPDEWAKLESSVVHPKDVWLSQEMLRMFGFPLIAPKEFGGLHTGIVEPVSVVALLQKKATTYGDMEEKEQKALRWALGKIQSGFGSEPVLTLINGYFIMSNTAAIKSWSEGRVMGESKRVLLGKTWELLTKKGEKENQADIETRKILAPMMAIAFEADLFTPEQRKSMIEARQRQMGGWLMEEMSDDETLNQKAENDKANYKLMAINKIREAYQRINNGEPNASVKFANTVRGLYPEVFFNLDDYREQVWQVPQTKELNDVLHEALGVSRGAIDLTSYFVRLWSPNWGMWRMGQMKHYFSPGGEEIWNAGAMSMVDMGLKDENGVAITLDMMMRKMILDPMNSGRTPNIDGFGRLLGKLSDNALPEVLDKWGKFVEAFNKLRLIYGGKDEEIRKPQYITAASRRAYALNPINGPITKINSWDFVKDKQLIWDTVTLGFDGMDKRGEAPNTLSGVEGIEKARINSRGKLRTFGEKWWEGIFKEP